MSSFFQSELQDFKSTSTELRKDYLRYFRDQEFEEPGDGGDGTLYDPSTESIIHYYPLNGDAQDAAGSLDLTESGSPNYVSAVDNEGVEFDGSDDSLEVPVSTIPTTSITVSLWLNRASGTASGNLIFNLFDVDNQNTIAGFSFAGTGDTVAGFITREGNTSQDAISGNTISTGTKTHVALTYDGNDLVLYQDGSQVNSQSFSGSLDSGSLDRLLVGGWQSASIFTPLNYIDEARIDNTALTASEIDTLYQAGV